MYIYFDWKRSHIITSVFWEFEQNGAIVSTVVCCGNLFRAFETVSSKIFRFCFPGWNIKSGIKRFVCQFYRWEQQKR